MSQDGLSADKACEDEPGRARRKNHLTMAEHGDKR